MQRSKHNLNRLPSLPTIAVQVLEVFGDPNAPVAKVGELVQADPAMASKILKAANSSRFGLKREVADVRQAITLIGKAKVTPIILSFSLAAESIVDPEHAATYQRFWLRSFAQATAAEVLGTPMGPAFAAECFTVNLLAGVGQLALLKEGVDDYIECILKAEAGIDTLDNLERSVYGVTNKQLTLEMLETSGLPRRCIEAIAAIVPDSQISPTDEDAETLGQVAGVADAFARYLCDSDSAVGMVLVQERMANLQVCNVDLESLSVQVRARMDESASLFDLDTTVLPDPEDLLQDALDQLADFTERIHDSPETVPVELVEENGRLKRRVDDLVRQTSTDPLTGVANRAFFDRRIVEMTRQAIRRGVEMGIAVIDIDNFKNVNDTYGHLAGDHILQAVAAALEQATRANETLARYGGEEFSVLLEDIKPGGMIVMGERLRTTVENLKIEFEGQPIPITISIGIATGLPTSEDYSKQLFSDADQALYAAKLSGRNRVIISPNSPQQHDVPPPTTASGMLRKTVC